MNPIQRMITDLIRNITSPAELEAGLAMLSTQPYDPRLYMAWTLLWVRALALAPSSPIAVAIKATYDALPEERKYHKQDPIRLQRIKDAPWFHWDLGAEEEFERYVYTGKLPLEV